MFALAYRDGNCMLPAVRSVQGTPGRKFVCSAIAATFNTMANAVAWVAREHPVVGTVVVVAGVTMVVVATAGGGIGSRAGTGAGRCTLTLSISRSRTRFASHPRSDFFAGEPQINRNSRTITSPGEDPSHDGR